MRVIDIENYTETDVKLYFNEINRKYNPNSNVDFVQCNYTLNDVEECKDKVKFELNQRPGSNVRKNSQFIESAQGLLIQGLMKETRTSTINVNVDQTQSSNSTHFQVQNYPQLETFVNIDTQQLNYVKGDFIVSQMDKTILDVRLSKPVTNVIETKLNSFQIPFSFYNLTSEKSNNTFMINNGTDIQIELPEGYYGISDIITELNLASNAYGLEFSHSTITNKVSVKNTKSSSTTITFFDSSSKTEPLLTLGWMLGFKDLTYDSSDDIYKVKIEIAGSSSIVAPYTQQVHLTKYVVLCLDDHNKTQQSSGIVQIDNSNPFIRSKTLPFDDATANGNCMTCENLDDISVPNMTKKQKYSQAQILSYKKQNQKHNLSNPDINGNNVFAILPIDYNSLNYNDLITVDTSSVKDNRVYNNPVTIDRLNIRILDDQGYELALNGNDWCFSLKMVSKN